MTSWHLVTCTCAFSEEEIGLQYSSLRTPPEAKKNLSLIYISLSREVPTIIIFFYFLSRNPL